MASTNDDTIGVLNDLIETCKDGVKGFRAAADAVGEARAKTLFRARGQAIETAVGELSGEVRKLGGDPETSGTAAGAAHRGWIGLKAAVTGRSDHAILAECERGEDHAVNVYEDALKKSLPADIHKIVERQYRGALSNRDEMRQLEHRDTTSSNTSSNDFSAESRP
ncbi:MAG: PA2169 family four-helix-bundle protein [Gemmatimonadota bacterium]|nr:PA2169 family four-helix-bundle protein [Gemmatimonadota bacterium]